MISDRLPTQNSFGSSRWVFYFWIIDGMNRLSFFLIIANVIALALILFWTLDKSQQDQILRFISAIQLVKSYKGPNQDFFRLSIHFGWWGILCKNYKGLG